MKAALRDRILGVPGWLTGPIFSKELRVSSRRRRNFVLRFTYLALLTFFVVIVWTATVHSSSGRTSYQISRMSLAGRTVIMTVCWFQLVALQLVAVVMLSTSISGEVYDRTLGVLLTTPIRMFQVVVGKLLSKLLQLVILLAISMPLLAVIRVFGGVPWGFVIASLGITLTACLAAGAVSMFFSIVFRRAFVTIIVTLAAGFLLYALLPAMLSLVAFALMFRGPGRLGGPGQTLESAMTVMMHGNPFYMHILLSVELTQPGATMGGPVFVSWPAHCGVMLAFTALMLFLCVLLVRRVALRQAAGDTSPVRVDVKAPVIGVAAPAAQPLPGPAGAPPPVPVPALAPVAAAGAGRIRRLTGSPMLWKELRTPLTRSTVKKVIGIVVPLSILAVMYILVGAVGVLDEGTTHVSFLVLFLASGALFTAVLAATPITSEKESRCWPLLLATPLSNWDILWAKALGVLRRCWPAWVALVGHLAFFTCIGFIHPIALLHMAMLVTWVVVFLTGTGLYFSARFRRTTTAVVMNLALAAVLWVIVPVVLLIVSEGEEEVTGLYVGVTNPVVQAVVVLNDTAGETQAAQRIRDLSYDWPWGSPDLPAGDTTALLVLFAFLHSVLGFVFALAAKARLRRNVF